MTGASGASASGETDPEPREFAKAFMCAEPGREVEVHGKRSFAARRWMNR